MIERVHNVRSANSRKRPSSGEDETPRKRGRPSSSKLMSRYPPLFVLDDDVSNERNKKLLEKEMEKDKSKVKKDTVLSLMKQCYASRREYIISETEEVTVTSILSAYPALSLPYIVSTKFNFTLLWIRCMYIQTLQIEQEMELVLEKRNVAKSATREWQLNWTPAIIDYSETLKGKQGTMFKQNQQMFQEQGMFIVYWTYI